MRLMVYWKSLIILKEIMKPSGKVLRVWAKNPIKIWNFWENFKISIRKSQWKIDFSSFLYDVPGPLRVHTALDNNIIFLHHFSVSGEKASPLLLRAPLLEEKEDVRVHEMFNKRSVNFEEWRCLISDLTLYLGNPNDKKF